MALMGGKAGGLNDDTLAHDANRGPRANPAALTAAQLARLLGVAEQKVRDHLDAGAPVGADGMINLVHYTAWLNRRLRQHDGD